MREVDYLHSLLFGRAANRTLVEAYLAVHSDLPDLMDADEEQRLAVREIVKSRLDALGIEPWLRTGHRRHLLSRKLLLISYLAECDAAHPEFRRRNAGCFRAFLWLGFAGVLAAARLIRGRVQKVIRGLV